MKPKYYIVGGYVRDFLLGELSKDVDFAVEANSYEEMRNDLIQSGVEIFVEKPEFLTIRGRHIKYGGVDFVLCRKESFYSDGRRPDSVEIGTLYDDLCRRDFSVNAMALPTEDLNLMGEGVLIDPFGGMDDLRNNMLRCVGETQERFEEDSLRLLRAARFHIVKGFRLHYEIQECLDDPCFIRKLANVSRERIYEELRKCFEFDTKKTLDFLIEFNKLRNFIFDECKIKLEPKL